MEADLQFEAAKLKRILKRDLPGNGADRILSAATAAAARVVVKKAKTPNYWFNDRSGKLRKSIKASKIKPKHKGNVRFAYAGAADFAVIQAGGKDAFYALFVEVGHGGSTRAGGRVIPGAKGRPFLRSAVEDTREEQVAALKRKADLEMRKMEKELLSGRIRPVTARALAAD